MPVFAGCCPYIDGVIVCADNFPSAITHMQHQPREILGQDQIAAAAQHQPLQTGDIRICPEYLQHSQ